LKGCVDSHHLAVVPQSSAKDQFFCTAYYLTLNLNWKAQSASKNLKKIVERELEAEMNASVI
jgi:hypothetical protein